jgi:sterol desaturase/sphingolipid hydroxylase (fatty acid hydroxylase superfamily)
MPAVCWKQFTPFYFYASAAACSLAWASAHGSVAPARALTLLALGLLSWGAVEYLLHRLLFHPHATGAGIARLAAPHRLHHERPRDTEQLFTGLRMSAPVALCYLLLARAALGDWAGAAYLFAGLVAGYFCYEWVHYQAHHGRPRLRPLRYLRRYHLLHHHRTPGLRFGVTSPLLDWLCGTFRPVRGRSREGAKCATGVGASPR